jgi:hypothetical protein
MIWSKLDFEREVRRQLVELESIRKRVPSNPEVHQRIDKLEASHKNILRKLAELFPQPKSLRTSSASPKLSAAVQAHAKKAIERYLKTVEQTARLRKLIAGDRQGVQTLLGRSRNSAPKMELPTLDTKCATCGKVLLSGLLGGEEVVLIDNSWHHRDCAGDPAGDGGGFSKPGLLN